MARKRDPRREQAQQIWLDSGGKKPLKDIAAELSVSDSQIRKWKSQDKWSNILNGNVTKSKGNVTNGAGAPIGNKNAIGNKGNSRASPPIGNTNALKTGEFETIFEDTLTDDEREIYSDLSDDPFFILSEEVRLLKIRQRRMMQRIKEAEAGLNQSETELLYELRGRKQYVDSEKGGKKIPIQVNSMMITEKREKRFRKIEDILAIEEALTRVSNALVKTTKQLADITMNESKLNLVKAQTKKVNAEVNKMDNTNNNVQSVTFVNDVPLSDDD